MTLPRIRVRTLMIAVAAVAVVVGSCSILERRSERFALVADFHEHEAHRYSSKIGGVTVFLTPKSRWHYEMSRKYYFASMFPIFPVAPGPPEPE